jgi:hypothetical protein
MRTDKKGSAGRTGIAPCCGRLQAVGSFRGALEGIRMFSRCLSSLGRLLANYLSKPNPRYTPLATSDPARLAAVLRPGDVLLVEGNTRFSTAIKYLTQSTWSHAALYVGPIARPAPGEEHDPPVLIEADIVHGVRAVPLSAYAAMHTRICRPVGLADNDRQRLVAFAIGSIGNTYDLKNIVDLVRYLLPTPPVPTRWRRRMLALGSGEPTKAICSSLIAQAFQSVYYPILPQVTVHPAPRPDCNDCLEERYRIRHHSLFTPRDFDISPYFAIVKPALEGGFDYQALSWDTPEGDPGVVPARSFSVQQAAPTTWKLRVGATARRHAQRAALGRRRPGRIRGSHNVCGSPPRGRG